MAGYRFVVPIVAEAEGPTASLDSAMVNDEFEAVLGHSFLAILRCPQPATIARRRKAWLRVAVIYNYTLI